MKILGLDRAEAMALRCVVAAAIEEGREHPEHSASDLTAWTEAVELFDQAADAIRKIGRRDEVSAEAAGREAIGQLLGA